MVFIKKHNIRKIIIYCWFNKKREIHITLKCIYFWRVRFNLALPQSFITINENILKILTFYIPFNSHMLFKLQNFYENKCEFCAKVCWGKQQKLIKVSERTREKQCVKWKTDDDIIEYCCYIPMLWTCNDIVSCPYIDQVKVE